MTRLTIAITFIRIFIDGPEVSLNGSPTVSPTINTAIKDAVAVSINYYTTSNTHRTSSL